MCWQSGPSSFSIAPVLSSHPPIQSTRLLLFEVGPNAPVVSQLLPDLVEVRQGGLPTTPLIHALGVEQLPGRRSSRGPRLDFPGRSSRRDKWTAFISRVGEAK